MGPCFHGVHGQRRRAFSDTKLFSQEVLELNYFSIGCNCIISEIGNDLESDPQNSLQEDFKVIVSEGNIKEGHTSDPRKTSADRRMIAIVDDEEFDPKFEERKASQIQQNT